MAASFLLSLREGLEAALIVGMLLGVLVKLKRQELNRLVWLGVGIALVGSLGIAIVLNLVGMEFEGRGEQIFEGSVMILAAGVLTWMILWMQKSSANRKNEIEIKTQLAVNRSSTALVAIAFLAVFREGIELSLFLLAVNQTNSPLQTALGAVTGLLVACLIGWMLFTSTYRLSLRGFFRVTNVLLIVFAAGLVAYGVHEFNEASLIPAVIEHVWDVNYILSDSSEVGLMLKALVGYNGNPSLTEVMAYLAYLVGIGYYVFKRRPAVSMSQLSPAD